jgi:hypothetical protein
VILLLFSRRGEVSIFCFFLLCAGI